MIDNIDRDLLGRGNRKCLRKMKKTEKKRKTENVSAFFTKHFTFIEMIETTFKAEGKESKLGKGRD